MSLAGAARSPVPGGSAGGGQATCSAPRLPARLTPFLVYTQQEGGDRAGKPDLSLHLGVGAALEREGSMGPEWEMERGGIQISVLSSQKEKPMPAMREGRMGVWSRRPACTAGRSPGEG